MNKTVDQTLLQRRSIRRYERENVSDEDMQFIYEAIRNTPTSYNGQQFSVIDITDQQLKEQIYEITHQKQIKTCNHFLVFLADYHKITVAADIKGVEMPAFPGTVDGLIVGVLDAGLAMMSAVVAAESRGLGTCCVGYARTVAPDELSALLELPRGVMIVCGLAIGVPRELPDLKPKEQLPLVIHNNRYEIDNLRDELIEYDNTVTHYNETREGTKSNNDWATHIIGYYREGMNYHLGQALRRRGFLTEPD
ncbi:MAG: nitroreductase family protein [Muribaculaceae bacterium]|nr:nitroreductase family protein [Muribaculaceae bacterium]